MVARAVSPTSAATSTMFAAATMRDASARRGVTEAVTVRPPPNHGDKTGC